MKINFDSSPSSPNESNGLATRYAPAKRQLAQWRWRILILLVISPLLVFLGRLLYGAVWADMPGFVIMDQTIVKAPLAGRLVSALPVGTQVTEGDTIAELVNEVLANEHQVLLSQRARALDYVEPPALPSARIPDLRLLAQHQRRHYEALGSLMASGAATRAEVAGAHAQLAATEGQLKDLQQEYDKALAAQMSARPPPLSARLEEVSTRLASLKLKAPASGTVAQVFGRRGEWINENTEVIDIRLRRPPRIEVYVEPAWARYATTGRWASVNFLDGYSHRARVREVKMSAHRLPADRANPLTVRHHSIIAILEPEHPLPASHQIHLLPVNVQFDLR